MPAVGRVLIAKLSEQRRVVQDMVHRVAVEIEPSGNLTGFDTLALTDRRAYFSFGLFVVHVIFSNAMCGRLSLRISLIHILKLVYQKERILMSHHF